MTSLVSNHGSYAMVLLKRKATIYELYNVLGKHYCVVFWIVVVVVELIREAESLWTEVEAFRNLSTTMRHVGSRISEQYGPRSVIRPAG